MYRNKILTGFASLLLSSAVTATEFHLVTENFPPLNMTNNGASYARNDRVSGFATDILRSLFKAHDINTRYTLMLDWDDAYSHAFNNTATGVYSTFRTPERENMFKWVGPLYEEEWLLLTMNNKDIEINSLNEVHKYKIGGHESDGITDYLIEQDIKVKTAQNDSVNVIRLQVGDIELWAASSLTAPYVAANFKVPVKEVFLFNKGTLWLAMHKDTDQEMIDKLNQTLREMHESGEIKEMIQQYLISYG